MIFNIILTFAAFYGGLIWLGFLTNWKIAVCMFIILAGHGLHLDYLFLRKKDLYHAMMHTWEKMFEKSLLDAADRDLADIDREMSMPGEEESLH